MRITLVFKALLIASLALALTAGAAHASNWFVLGPGYVPSPSLDTVYVNQTVYPGTGFVTLLQTTSDVSYAIIPNNWVITSGTAYTYQGAASSSSGGATWFYGTSAAALYETNFDALVALSISNYYNVAAGSSTGVSSTQYGMAGGSYHISSETSGTPDAKWRVFLSSPNTH